MKRQSIIFILVLFSLISCAQKNNSNVDYFKNTPAYSLAKAIEKEDIQTIEKLVKEKPVLLNYRESNFNRDILSLSIDTECYESFKKLLELGANPNSINPDSKKSILIESLKYYNGYNYDLRYPTLLLKYGANPNYSVENGFTDDKGYHHFPTSPLVEAARLNLDIVKLLIKYGADPYKKNGKQQVTPFESALSGNENKYKIINYFIDTLKVDIKAPLRIREKDTLYIQDYVKKYLLKDKEGQKLKIKLENLGVDFKDYKYRL